MTRSSKGFLSLVSLLLCLCVQARANDDPAQLYAQMQHAIHSIDYEGHFVFQVGDRLDAMYVVHRVQNGRELERLVALDGAQKQVIRGAEGVACLDPHRSKVSVLGSSTRRVNLPSIGPEELKKLYRFELGDEVRVAGRPARLLLIQPLDDLRYGYRIALDEETRLPLQSVMLDSEGKTRSQTLFVDLKTGKHITPIERDLSALQLTESPPDKPQRAEDTQAGRTKAHSNWRFSSLPNGFRLVKVLPAPEQEVQHFLITDGLTSVSVYLEPADSQGFDGFSRIGTTEVFGAHHHGMQLTVVGEVPRRTLELIADAVEPQ
jgi:sigma-E factor negative regulatory protein RseB